jgi:hypothetical protein
MNTNGIQEYEIPVDWYEIPVDWDASIQAVAREGYRAGVEAVATWVRKYSSPSEKEWYALLNQKAFDEFIHGLLAEQKETTIQGHPCGHM